MHEPVVIFTLIVVHAVMNMLTFDVEVRVQSKVPHNIILHYYYKAHSD